MGEKGKEKRGVLRQALLRTVPAARIKPGGVILVDNLLWYGRVVDPANTDKATVALREFNDFLAEDDRVSFVIVPIGDGMSLCIKN